MLEDPRWWDEFVSANNAGMIWTGSENHYRLHSYPAVDFGSARVVADRQEIPAAAIVRLENAPYHLGS
jgi:hypothetical protein